MSYLFFLMNSAINFKVNKRFKYKELFICGSESKRKT